MMGFFWPYVITTSLRWMLALTFHSSSRTAGKSDALTGHYYVPRQKNIPGFPAHLHLWLAVFLFQLSHM